MMLRFIKTIIIVIIVTIAVTTYISYGLIGVVNSQGKKEETPTPSPLPEVKVVKTVTPLLKKSPGIKRIKKKDNGQLKLEMVWRGSINKKEVALTFDDGPSPKTTEKILKILRDNHIHATFFVIGKNAERFPKLLKEISDEGNEIGNHSYSHPNSLLLSPSKLRQELSKTDKIITKITGKKPKFFRPPSGSFGYNLSFIAASLKYTMVLWWIDTYDWKEPGKKKVMEIVKYHLTNGAIILMHENHKTTIEALPDVIKYIKSKGYKFVTLSELLD